MRRIGMHGRATLVLMMCCALLGWSGAVLANHSEGLARILARPTLSLCPGSVSVLKVVVAERRRG